VVIAAMLLALFGSYASMHTSLDVLPEFAPPQIILQTEAPGMVAEEVEALVSLPLESVLNGTPGVTRQIDLHAWNFKHHCHF
jgi:nickel/cobalt tolerance cation efflux system protein